MLHPICKWIGSRLERRHKTNNLTLMTELFVKKNFNKQLRKIWITNGIKTFLSCLEKLLNHIDVNSDCWVSVTGFNSRYAR